VSVDDERGDGSITVQAPMAAGSLDDHTLALTPRRRQATD
jgi:hypothetical protein